MTSIEDHTQDTLQSPTHSPIDKVSHQHNNGDIKSEKKKKVFSIENKEKFKHELIDKEHFSKLKNVVKKTLKLMGYYVISGEKGLGKRIYKKLNISFIAFKIIEISNKKRICLIVPIKLTPLKGILIVSNSSVKYRPITKINKMNPRINKAYVLPLNDTTAKSQEIVFKSLVSKGVIYRYLQKYLRNDFYIEKTILKKPLFFRSNNFHYKVVINPMFVAQSSVEFIEKSIPFAYRKDLNVYGVSISQFRALLNYLENKYFLIESEKGYDSAIERRRHAKKRLGTSLRSISIPFLALGIGILVAIVLGTSFLYDLLLQLGYASILILLVILFFLQVKYLSKVAKLKKEFKIPYNKVQFSFDEAEILSIKESLSEELVDQFSYECFGFEESESSIFSDEFGFKPKKKRSADFNTDEYYNGDMNDEDLTSIEYEIGAKKMSYSEKLNNNAEKIEEKDEEDKDDTNNSRLKKELLDKYKSFME